MEYRFNRQYRGQVKMVVFDLAGTTVDYGSCAPAGAFIDLFKKHGIEASMEHARLPMGMHKRDHIRIMSQIPEIARHWKAVKGKECTEGDIEKLFQEFIPIQLECLPKYNTLIPGVIEAVRELKSMGIKIAATTGYNEEMLDIVLEATKKQGFVPDMAFCAAQVLAGRPAPWLIYECMAALDSYPPESVVKIGDTIADVQSGLNAGVWSVGVAKTGNMLGLNEVDTMALSKETLEPRLHQAREKLAQAGAHYVIDAVANCVGVINAINDNIVCGQKP